MAGGARRGERRDLRGRLNGCARSLDKVNVVMTELELHSPTLRQRYGCSCTHYLTIVCEVGDIRNGRGQVAVENSSSPCVKLTKDILWAPDFQLGHSLSSYNALKEFFSFGD